MKTLRTSLSLTAILLTLCCVLYPALVTAAAQALFPAKASGEAVVQDGTIRGARLIGQTFADDAQWPGYFWGRPSAASVDAATSVLLSSGSNLGPTNPALASEVEARVKALRDTGVTGPIPVDLITKSGSGLDPHLSPAAVAIQIPRVARARGLREADVRGLVEAHTEGSTLGFLGEPRVNVLLLNLALDARTRAPRVEPIAAPSVGATAAAR